MHVHNLGNQPLYWHQVAVQWLLYCRKAEIIVEYKQYISENGDVIHIFIHNLVDKRIVLGITL